MSKNMFSINEIISIVMTIVEDLSAREIYGASLDDELYFPKPIIEKLNSLTTSQYEDLITKASNIAEEVYEYKSGELNELNSLHQEIKLLASELLKDYIDTI